jgi:hypothetical protein
VAAILSARKRIVQFAALPIMFLLIVSTAVQLTRARWIGIVIGILLTSLWLTLNSNSRISVTLRRRLSVLLAILAVTGIVTLLVIPGILSDGGVINRLISIFTDIESGSGTVAIRVLISKEMTAILGERWPFGLGFVPPFSHFYPGLPGGSIRDPDVGVLNAVMTMGILGAILIYVPVVVMLVTCLRRLSTRRISEFNWLYFGGAVWIVATLASSVTLITLFSTSGLALAAVFLTVLAHPSISEARQPATSPSIALSPKPAMAHASIT